MDHPGSEFSLEIDRVNKDQWSDYLLGFEDASIYHTWTYGSLRWGERNLSHMVLRRGSEIVAMAQTRIVKLPVVSRGIAYIAWGPLWRRCGRTASTGDLRAMIRAL